MLKRIFSVFLFLCTVITFFWPTASVRATVMPAMPELLVVESAFEEKLDQPLLLVAAPHGTEVLIYVDGSFAGFATLNEAGSLVDYFIFRFSSSVSVGGHTAFAVARDKTSMVLSPPTVWHEFEIRPIGALAPLPAPTLISATKTTITGLTRTETKVHVFIDGIERGVTQSLSHPSGTANFAFRPLLDLGIGLHTVWTVAEDVNGKLSAISNVMQFRIDDQVAAPTLLSPVTNKADARKPFIVGLAENDTEIRVFIDNKLNGVVMIRNAANGTGNFAYEPFLPLAAGAHSAYALAVDSRGRVSSRSNAILFNVSAIPTPRITDQAAEEARSVSARTDELLNLAQRFKNNSNTYVSERDLKDIAQVLNGNEKQKLNSGEISLLENMLETKRGGTTGEGVTADEPGDVSGEPKKSELDEVKDLLDRQQGTTSTSTGLINESRERQGKLRLNLIIFILFLLAVVGWIFWVNRELIKERREKNMENDDEEKTDRGEADRP